MITASLAGDLGSLTPLILGTFVFIALLVFHRQIKGAIDRIKNLEAQRGGVTVRAELSDEAGETSSEENSESASRPSSAGPREEPHEQPADDSLDSTVVDEAADVRSRMFRSYARGEEEEGDKAFEALQAIESDPKELKLDRVRRLGARFIGGIDPKALDELKALVSDPEIASYVHRMVGICFESIKRPSEAASAFANSRDEARDEDERAEANVLRSQALAQAGDTQRGIDELIGEIRDKPGKSAELLLWEGLAKACEKTGQKELRAIALHQEALLVGNDAERWFQAGYAYSMVDSDKLNFIVIHCYLTALSFNPRHQWAKNNLGVLLRRVGLPIPSSRFYREAIDLGNTLAMANVGGIYLRQGLDAEAEELLQRAATQEKPDDKVSSVSAELTSNRSEQNQKFAKYQDDGSRVSEFMGRYGQAQIDPTPQLPVDGLINGTTRVAIEMSNGSLIVSWETGTFRSQRKFSGTIKGRGISGKFEKEGFSPDLDSVSWERDGSGFGVIDTEGKVIDLMRLQGHDASFLRITSTS